MYTIGQFSRLSQIPVKTLRYYDEIGLLRPARIDGSTGYRYYGAAQFEQLNRILVFRDMGFSLSDIRTLVAENVPPEQIREMLCLKHQELERRVDEERARLRRAEARLDVIERCGQAAAFEVAVRGVASQLVASVRETVACHDESERLFDELDHHMGRRHHRSQRAAIWHACADGAIDCEALVFLPARVAATRRVRVYELPAHRVASLVYRGDVDFMPAYRAMRAWIGASGVDVIGPKREIFLDDGHGGRRESVTEIQFPIADTDVH